MERVLEYWQNGLLQQSLAEILPDKIYASAWEISRQECNAANFSQKLSAQKLVVAPIYAQKGAEYFFPYLLVPNLGMQHGLPIFPKYVLEPSIPRPILLGEFDSFENYFIMQPPIWVDNPSQFSWGAQLEYAANVLATVTDDVWQEQLQNSGFVIKNSALVFPLNAVWESVNLKASILEHRNKLELISAERNSGKTTYAQNIINDAWVEAAIKQNPAPKYVFLDYATQPCYAGFGIAASDDSSQTQEEVHARLCADFDAYLKGKQLISMWTEAKDRLESKYADKGGVELRIEQLRASLKDAHVHNRHLTVLHSIWLRNLESVSVWLRMFDFLPLVQSYRLKRLYTFFKQNFADDKVRGLNQRQLEDIILDKMRRAISSERFVADTLHQTENDYSQVRILYNKCLDWAHGQDFNRMLDNLWQSVLQHTALYWRNYRPEKIVDAIDLLIVERAEYLSPMQAAQLLAITKRAIIMGNYNPIVIPRFSVQIDYELSRNFGLAECDADFEDLQFDGVLASLGNLWNLAAQQEEADKIFQAYPKAALGYEYKNIFSASEDHYGSRLNMAEITAVLTWLRASKHAPDAKIAIYTTFGAQVQHLRARLQDTEFAEIPVRLVQEPCFEVADINILLPVYTSNDLGPYVFDRGSEILENLIANTAQKIVVIGDMAIFKSNLHSASGKFAKLLFNKQKQQQEVECV